MRTLWLTNDEGEAIRSRGYLALATEVWSHLYRTIRAHEGWPILTRLWREQWGPEADLDLSPENVAALARELEALALFLGPDTPQEVVAFLDDLATFCTIAGAKRLGLRVEAD